MGINAFQKWRTVISLNSHRSENSVAVCLDDNNKLTVIKVSNAGILLAIEIKPGLDIRNDMDEDYESEVPTTSETLQGSSRSQGPSTEMHQTTSETAAPSYGAEGGNNPLNTIVSNPKHPDYLNIERRINSFRGWPSHLDQTHKKMAEAGFFFVGLANFTRCFCCGEGLRNWEPGDDPILEHTRWFPQCEYIVRLKGERYVAAVQRRHREHIAAQQQEKTRISQRRDGNCADSDQTAQLRRLFWINNGRRENRAPPNPLETEAAAVMREMGYPDERTREAILAVRRQTGSSTVTTQQVLTWLLDDEDRQMESTLSDDIQSFKMAISVIKCNNARKYVTTRHDNIMLAKIVWKFFTVRQVSKDIVRELHLHYRSISVYGLYSYFDPLNDGSPLSTQEQMQYESLRLASFVDYRGNGNALALARNGFYHNHSEGPNHTRCYLCNTRLDKWECFDDIVAIHRDMSPNCPFVSNIDTANVPITSRSEGNPEVSSTHLSIFRTSTAQTGPNNIIMGQENSNTESPIESRSLNRSRPNTNETDPSPETPTSDNQYDHQHPRHRESQNEVNHHHQLRGCQSQITGSMQESGGRQPVEDPVCTQRSELAPSSVRPLLVLNMGRSRRNINTRFPSIGNRIEVHREPEDFSLPAFGNTQRLTVEDLEIEHNAAMPEHRNSIAREFGVRLIPEPTTSVRSELPEVTVSTLGRQRAARSENQRGATASESVEFDLLPCIVCRRRSASLLLLPCQHRVCCENCKEQMSYCPVCGSEI